MGCIVGRDVGCVLGLLLGWVDGCPEGLEVG